MVEKSLLPEAQAKSEISHLHKHPYLNHQFEQQQQ